MTFHSNEHPRASWTFWERFTLRFGTIFFLLLLLPIDLRFWKTLFSSPFWGLQKVLILSTYTTRLLPLHRWGWASYLDWAIFAVLSIAGAFVWSRKKSTAASDDELFYWLRVLLRYRLAIGLLAFGVIKLWPLQFPHLSLSDLNTNYGDFLPWKIYYLTNSAASAGYRQSLGLVEIASGILLLWRPTATIGAGGAAFVLTNIVMANFAYQLGDHVYATALLLIAGTLIAYDVQRLWSVLVEEKSTEPETFEPRRFLPYIPQLRTASQGLVAFFLVVYSVTAYANYRHNWPFPNGGGVASLKGLYNVENFSVNGKEIPYSLVDPVRWQNVVFEPWSTVSIRIYRPVTLEVANPELVSSDSDQRRYEYAGNAGRHFYKYTANLTSNTLHLDGENDPGEHLQLHFDVQQNHSIVLDGTDDRNNVLHAVLQPVQKDYLLLKGRRHPLKIY